MGGSLLFGLALGVGTYSYLTAMWAADCTNGCANLPMILRNLFYCMLGHTVFASILMSTPRKQLANDDIRHLQYNLMNT